MSDCGNCDDFCRDLSLLDGDKGDPGAPGQDGTFGANSDQWQFNTAVVGNPGAGKLLFDNANLTAATSISVSNTDQNGNTVTTWLAALNTSNATLKGFIRVNKEFDSTAFVMYSVSAYTANAGYGTFTINYLGGSSASPFANNDNLIYSYVISGNNGTAGTSGTTIVFNQFNLRNTIAVGPQSFNLDIPANTLVGDGDIVEFEADIIIRIDASPVTADTMSIASVLNGSTSLIALNPPNSTIGFFMPAIKVKMSVCRTTVTTGVQTQESYTIIPTIFSHTEQNAAMDFTIPNTFSIDFNNNITDPVNLAATPFAIITRATMKYIPA